MKEIELNELEELSRKALESVQNELAARKDYEDDAASIKQALNAASAKDKSKDISTDFASALVDAAKTLSEQNLILESSDESNAQINSASSAQLTSEQANQIVPKSEQEGENISISTSEREYLSNIHERILVLFSALQDDDGKRHLPLVVEFLEFLLASIEHRLKDQ